MSMKKLSYESPIGPMYGTAQIADFMEVNQRTVSGWVRKGELVPTAVMDSKGNRFNPALIELRPGIGPRGKVMYLFSSESVKRFLRGRWIAEQDWGEGRKRQSGDECPEVLRV